MALEEVTARAQAGGVWWAAGLALGSLTLVCSATIAEEILEPPAVRDRLEHSDIAFRRVAPRAAILAGGRLFEARFNQLDGAGRPGATGDSKPTPRVPLESERQFNRVAGLDANSCAGCHNQPRIGGSGDFATNVFVGAHFSDPPLTSITPEGTNERGTPSLFGIGLVELVAREITQDLRSLRDAAIRKARDQGSSVSVDLKSKEVHFGRLVAHADGTLDFSRLEGIDYDLTLRPFGTRGVAGSVREFTVAALNQHHGIQALERFGWERTGTRDFDQDGIADEFSYGQVSALVMFQTALPRPDTGWWQRASSHAATRQGFQTFGEIGCASCHRPLVELRSRVFTEPGSSNRPGTLSASDTSAIIRWPVPESATIKANGRRYVGMFSDLKRHVMCDEEIHSLCNELKKQDNVPLDQFVTPRLWDVGLTSPYCHRGNCLTVTDAILAHGGEARRSRDAFISLDALEKRGLVGFLLELGKPAEEMAPAPPASELLGGTQVEPRAVRLGRHPGR